MTLTRQVPSSKVKGNTDCYRVLFHSMVGYFASVKRASSQLRWARAYAEDMTHFLEHQLYLHRHDLPAGHVSHLLHHPVRTSPQLHYRLQVICLHLKVLQGTKVVTNKASGN